MMDFQKRLEKAIHRGQHRSQAKARQEKAKALSEEELKRLHSEYRLLLSEHVEGCLKKLPFHFPGFQYEAIYGEAGWGAACRRDDMGIGSSHSRTNFYSRLEITVRPFSSGHILELTAKGTIRNKEVFSRKHFEKLSEADTDGYIELIDLWVLEYAELFAASS